MVGARAQEAVVVVVGVLVVDHVRAAHAVEHVDVVHGMEERLRWKFCRSSMVRTMTSALSVWKNQVHSGPGRMRKVCSRRSGADGSGDGRLGGDVADGPRQALDQEIDERLEMMPVLVRFGVEDDAAVARRKLLEAADSSSSPATCSCGVERALLVRVRRWASRSCPLPASCRGRSPTSAVPEHLDARGRPPPPRRSRPRGACCPVPGSR